MNIPIILLQWNGPTGATFVSKSAQKNARRRAKKTTGKPEADEGENVGVGQGQFSTTTTGSSSQVETAAQGEAWNEICSQKSCVQ